MRRRVTFLPVLLAFAILAGCEMAAPTPVPTPTAYAVAPAFEEWYTLFGPELLGAPITGQCQPGDGMIVQYFEHVRLERTTDGAIQFYPLGQWALSGVRNRVAAPAPADSPSRTFPETGYTVQDQFLTFYEENNGEQLLGPPLSEQLVEGDLRLQYFRNGRLEWRPEAPPDQRVRLGSLGQAHFQENRGNGLQCDLMAIFTPLPELNLTASVADPILYPTTDEQVVYVKATGPQGLPYSGVNIHVTVHYLGQAIEVRLGETGQDGVASGSLGAINFEPGHDVQLVVTAHSSDGATLGRTTVSFSTWY